MRTMHFFSKWEHIDRKFQNFETEKSPKYFKTIFPKNVSCWLLLNVSYMKCVWCVASFGIAENVSSMIWTWDYDTLASVKLSVYPSLSQIQAHWKV